MTWERGGETHEVTARWVCDASGRRHVLQRQLGHKVTKEPRLATAAAWGRYRNVAGLDAEGQDELREACRRLLGAGPFVVPARAWAVRGLA